MYIVRISYLFLFFNFHTIIDPIKRISIITRYIGNASSVNPNVFNARKLVNALNSHPANAIGDSVSGCFHHLISVGIAASASLMIAKIIAIAGFFVIYRKTNASNEKNQQT